MTTLTGTLAVLALTVGLAGSAFAQSSPPQGAMPGMAAQPSDAPSTAEFKAADQRMMQNMQVPYTGNADVDLRTRMIPHHQSAISMAEVALKYAKDPTTRQLAQKIVDDQKKEIVEMQDWLKQHGK